MVMHKIGERPRPAPQVPPSDAAGVIVWVIAALVFWGCAFAVVLCT